MKKTLDDDVKGVRVAWPLVVAPGSLIMFVMFGVPMIVLTIYSLFKDLGRGRLGTELTLSNYVKFLTDSFYLQILYETFLLSFFVALMCTVMGYPVAYVLARTQSRLRGLLIFMVAAPLLVSVVIRNLGWLPVLGLNGMLSKTLIASGLTTQPTSLLNSGYGVVIGLVHALLPMMILSLMTVIQRIHPSLEEAATNLGASWFYRFRRVILPLSLKGLAAGFVLVFTVSISSYTTPAVLGGGKVLMMSTFIEKQVSFVLAYAFSATASIILMLVTCVLTFGILNRLERNA